MAKREGGPRPDPDGSVPAAPRADQLVASVRDDPAQRLRLAAGFYDQRVGGRSIRAYRRAEVAFWLTFLRRPTPRAWYRAHNASIVDGYLRHRDLVPARDARRASWRPPPPGGRSVPLPPGRAARQVPPGAGQHRYRPRRRELLRPDHRLRIIAPRIPALYRAAAEDLDEPRIVELCTDEYPVYAWPYEHRYVWRTDRSPIAIALIRAVVGRPPRASGVG